MILATETQQLIDLRCTGVSQFDFLSVDIDDEGHRFVLSITSKTGHRYPSFGARQWAEATPSAKECEIPGAPGNHYFAPAGIFTVLRCVKAFTNRISFLNEETEILWNVLLTQFAAGMHRVQISAEWQAHQTVPAHNLSVAEGIELLPYQEVAAWLATLGDSFAFFMEQGTGKTPTAIATMCTWLEMATTFQRVLVVSPRNVVPNWVAELKAFTSQPIKVDAIRGLEIARLGKLAGVLKPADGVKAGVAVINYDGAMSMAEVLSAIPWDIVILDEAHSIKSPTTQRTKFFLNRLRQRAKRRLILTGTPIANTAMDLWAQLEFLGPATSGFPTFKAYKDFYARVAKNENSGFEQIVGMQHIPILQEVLARNAFIIRKKEAMPWLPEKVYSIESIEMSPAQKEMYKKVATQLAIEIEADIETQTDNRQLLINSVLTKLLRLAQVTSGFVSWDPVISPDGELIRPRIIEDLPENPKIDWCVEQIKKHPLNEKILFWSWMTHDINALSARLTAEGIKHVVFKGTTSDEDRVEAERAFNKDPECRVFIGNQAAGGTGLNLLGHDPKNPEAYDTDATMSVYIAQNWNAVHRSQSEDRNHRRGTRKQIQAVTLACESTIDEDIHERVTSKRQAALEISDIRSLLTKIIGDLS